MDPSPSGAASSSSRRNSFGGQQLDPSPSHSSSPLRREGERGERRTGGSKSPTRRRTSSSKSPTKRYSKSRSRSRSFEKYEPQDADDNDGNDERIDSPTTRSSSTKKYSQSHSKSKSHSRSFEKYEREDAAYSSPTRSSSRQSSPDRSLQSSSKANTSANANVTSNAAVSSPTTIHTPPSFPGATAANRAVSAAALLNTPPPKDNKDGSVQSASKSTTFLSRKAHRLSRRKRASAASASSGGGGGTPAGTSSSSSFAGGASLLNKLFCHSSTSGGGASASASAPSTDESQDDGICSGNNSLKENDASGAGAAAPDGSGVAADASGCVSLAMTHAVESLQLDREASVRQTIQRSMHDAKESVLDVVCRAAGASSSPPTHTTVYPMSCPGPNKSLFDDEDDNNSVRSPTTDETGNDNKSRNKGLVVDDKDTTDSWDEPSKLDKEGEQDQRDASDAEARDSPPLVSGASADASASPKGLLLFDKDIEDEDERYKPILASAAKAIATAVASSQDGDGSSDGYNDNSDNGKCDDNNDGLDEAAFLPNAQVVDASEDAASAFLPNSLVGPLPVEEKTTATNITSSSIGTAVTEAATADIAPTTTVDNKEQLPSPSNESAHVAVLFTWAQVQERLTEAVAMAKEDFDLELQQSLQSEKDGSSEQLRLALEGEREQWQLQAAQERETEYERRLLLALEEAKREWQAQHDEQLNRVVSECHTLENALSEREKDLEQQRTALQTRMQQEFLVQINQHKDQVQLAKRRAVQQQSELEQVTEQLDVTNGLVRNLKDQVEQLETGKSTDEATMQDYLQAKDDELKDLQEQMLQLETSKSELEARAVQELEEKVQTLELSKSQDEQTLQEQLKAKDEQLLELEDKVSMLETIPSTDCQTLQEQSSTVKFEEQQALQEQLDAKDEQLQQLREQVSELEAMKSTDGDQTLLEQLKAKDLRLQDLQEKMSKLETTKPADDLTSSLQEQLEAKDRTLQELQEQLAELETSQHTNDQALQYQLRTMEDELREAVEAKEDLEREKEFQVHAVRRLQDKLQQKQMTSPKTNTPAPTSPPTPPTITAATSSATMTSPSFSSSVTGKERQVGDLQSDLRNLQERLKSSWSGSPTKMPTSPLQPMFEQRQQEKRSLEEYQSKLQATRDEYETQIEELQGEIAQLRQDHAEAVARADQLQLGQDQVIKAQQQVLEQTHQDEIAALQQAVEAQQEVVAEKEAHLQQLQSQLEQVKAEVAELQRQQHEQQAQPDLNDEAFSLLEQQEEEMVNLRQALNDLEQEKEENVSSLEVELLSLEERLEEKEKELAMVHSKTAISSPVQGHGSPTRSTTSSRSPSGIRPPSSSRKETSIELHEREKEVLREQIAVLEHQLSTMSQQHERALQELRRQSEQELVDIKKDMETRIEKHMQTERDLKDSLTTVDSADKEELLERIEQLEAEKKSDRGGCLREVQKKEDLLQRISTLEKREQDLSKEQELALQDVRAQSETEIRRLQKEIERERNVSLEKERELQQAISETESFEKEELLQRIDKLEALLENERNGAVLVKMKIGNLEKDLKAAREVHHDEVRKLRAMSEAEIRNLNEELQELSAIEEAMQITTNERDVFEETANRLKTTLEDERRQHLEQLEDMRNRHEEAIEALQKESTEAQESAVHEAQERINALEKKLKETEKEKAEIQSRMGLSPGEERVLRDELAGLKGQVEHDKSRFDEQLKKLKEEHAKESDDFLAQLNLVEKESKEKLAVLQKTASEKDAIITALGSQLADAQTRSMGNEEERQRLKTEMERTKSEAAGLDKDLEKLRGELKTLKTSHESYTKKAEAAKEKAAEDAREEMIERAEVQFKQANELYVKLKKQYDLCKRKVESLETQLKKQKEISAKAGSSEIDLKSEIALIKVSHANAESASTQKEREYKREMARLLEAAETFERKLKAAEQSSRHANQKLTTLQAEKETLKKEHDEVKGVCEELMAMVEGQHHEC